MDLFEAIEKRHSYRGDFKDLEVSRKDLIKIVDAGLKAPTGKNAQTTKFVIVDDRQLVAKISAMPKCNKAFQQAKAYIVCIIDKEPESIYFSHSFQLEDCSAAVVNMLLTITALGYATVWIDGWLRVDKRAEQIAEYLNVPDNKKIQIILPIGVPMEIKTPPKKMHFEERASFNYY